MKRLYILAALVVAAALVFAACGGGGDGNGNGEDSGGITPLPGNTELVVGENRLAIGLADNETNEPILDGGDVHLTLLFEEEVRSEHDATWVWAIPDVTGFYVANVSFDTAGQWSGDVTLTRDDGRVQEVGFNFPVTEDSATPSAGDPAIATENLTLGTSDLVLISTDAEPQEELYELTVTEAIAANEPFVIIFATPKFCTSRFCGPVVDNVKEVWQEYGDRVNFIHIEPYELNDEGALVQTQSGAPVPAQPTLDWNLQTEPWVFVVDADGIVSARFEQVVSPAELSAAVDAVLG